MFIGCSKGAYFVFVMLFKSECVKVGLPFGFICKRAVQFQKFHPVSVLPVSSLRANLEPSVVGLQVGLYIVLSSVHHWIRYKDSPNDWVSARVHRKSCRMVEILF